MKIFVIIPCYNEESRVEDVLERFLTAIPTRFEVADANIQLQGAILDIDEGTGKARSVVRIQRKLSSNDKI